VTGEKVMPNQSDTASDLGKVKRRTDRKLVFAVPSLLTTGNIFCGFYSITESLLGSQAFALHDISSATEHFDRAAINIGFAYLFDALDGRIARMTGATTEFGVELDSIADVASFGIAPALLAFAWGYGTIPQLHKIAWAVSFVFVVSGALRLARFNVQARGHNQTAALKNRKIDKKAFVGMPIPAGAALIAAIVHFWPVPLVATDLSFSLAGRTVAVDSMTLGIALLILTACLAALMVSTIRYSSFKGVGAGKYHPRVLVLGLTLLVVAIWFYSRWSLLILSSVYVLHGVVGKAWSLMRAWRRGGGSDRARLELDEPGRLH
jgi:CDP-diacylglycerol--serine O-phosphatidyltransferase